MVPPVSANCPDDVAPKVRYITLLVLSPPNGLMHLNSGPCTEVYVCMLEMLQHLAQCSHDVHNTSLNVMNVGTELYVCMYVATLGNDVV